MFPGNDYTGSSREIFGLIVYYVVPAVSKANRILPRIFRVFTTFVLSTLLFDKYLSSYAPVEIETLPLKWVALNAK
jgi:hypothetical protein